MRTTITPDPDVQQLLKRAMREQDAPFKRVVNDALRRGLRPSTPAGAGTAFVQPVFDLGEPLVAVTSFNRLSDELETEAFVEKMRRESAPR